MSEIAQTVQIITTFLTPFLPGLMLFGTEAGKEVVKKAVDTTWDKADEIWQTLHPKIEANTDLAVAAKNLAKRQQDLEQAPEDADKQKALERYKDNFQDALIEILENDAGLAKELTAQATSEIIQRIVADQGSQALRNKMTAKKGVTSTQEITATNHSTVNDNILEIN